MLTGPLFSKPLRALLHFMRSTAPWHSQDSFCRIPLCALKSRLAISGNSCELQKKVQVTLPGLKSCAALPSRLMQRFAPPMPKRAQRALFIPSQLPSRTVHFLLAASITASSRLPPSCAPSSRAGLLARSPELRPLCSRVCSPVRCCPRLIWKCVRYLAFLIFARTLLHSVVCRPGQK